MIIKEKREKISKTMELSKTKKGCKKGIKKTTLQSQMTDHKIFPVPIGLVYWNYKTFIAPELLG